MAKRALLVGCQTFGLRGVDADVALMAEVLARRGFEITTCTGDNATYQGILDHLDRLAAATSPGDAVVASYSGHGSCEDLVDWSARQESGRRPFAQFIVPCDIAASTGEQFLGILSEELTLKQRLLTERTTNVTWMLDCCHSATMARSLDLIPRAHTLAQRQIARDGISVRLARLAETTPDNRGYESNPDAVRLVACGRDQAAFEGPSQRFGGHHGLLTESFAVALEQLGDQRVTWWRLIERIRHRITLLSSQRPAVEGPVDRLLFELERRPIKDGVTILVDNGRATIGAAELFGIAIGDTYRVVDDAGEHRSEAEVVRVSGGQAELRLSLDQSAGAFLGVPLKTTGPRRPVRIDIAGRGREELARRVAASSRIRVADEETDDRDVLAFVRDDGGVVIDDVAGCRLRKDPVAADTAGLDLTVTRLELLAKAERLRDLAHEDRSETFAVPVRIQLYTHADGMKIERLPSGEHLKVGERITVVVENESEVPVYLWCLDIGASRCISLVTNGEPMGARLEPRARAGSVREVWAESTPQLTWPPEVPSDGERPESFVFVLANRAQDLSGLQDSDQLSRSARRGLQREPLPGLLDELRTGTREAPTDTAGFRYRVEVVNFSLVPNAAS
jgi:hypothetical protein